MGVCAQLCDIIAPLGPHFSFELALVYTLYTGSGRHQLPHPNLTVDIQYVMVGDTNGAAGRRLNPGSRLHGLSAVGRRSSSSRSSRTPLLQHPQLWRRR